MTRYYVRPINITMHSVDGPHPKIIWADSAAESVAEVTNWFVSGTSHGKAWAYDPATPSDMRCRPAWCAEPAAWSWDRRARQ